MVKRPLPPHVAVERLIHELLPHLIRAGIVKSPDEVDHTYLAQAVDSVRERSKTLVEMTQWLRFYFTDHIIYDKAAAKFFTAESAALLARLVQLLEGYPASMQHRSSEPFSNCWRNPG